MNRIWVTCLCAAVLLPVAAVAEDAIESGQWKVTSNTRANGETAPQQVKAICLTTEQASDLGKTFGPQMNTVNSTCERTEYETGGRKLKWRMQCKGQLDMDVSGNFNFDGPTHYTAVVTAKGWMAGALVSDVKTEIEGERVGACAQ
jgi:hypothetical protein